MRDLFKVNAQIPRYLLDEFIILNYKIKPEIKEKKIMDFILKDKLFEQNYCDLINNADLS